jgi:hypothetical protein
MLARNVHSMNAKLSRLHPGFNTAKHKNDNTEERVSLEFQRFPLQCGNANVTGRSAVFAGI